MLRSITRTLSFFSKWLAEVIRQPTLMLTLIVGPFLILLAFGQGIKLGVPQPRTLLVVPAGGIADSRLDPRGTELDRYLRIVGETSDLAEARERLKAGDVDVVALLPPDPAAAIESGQRARITILTNEIDPVRGQYARAYLQDQIATLNQQTLEQAIAEGLQQVAAMRQTVAQARSNIAAMRAARGDIDAVRAQARGLTATVNRLSDSVGQASAVASSAAILFPSLEGPNRQASRLAEAVDRLRRDTSALEAQLGPGGALPTDVELSAYDSDLAAIDGTLSRVEAAPAWVLSAPFQLQLENVAPFVPTYIGFYAPAVLALLLQHLGVTLGALSMARVRLLGLMELLRTAPVRPFESVVGNYLAYGTLCAVAGGALLAALVWGLGVPVFGSWWQLTGTLALLIVTALGIGFIISLLSSSEQQAAQLAMLALIGSVFFSGFIVSVDAIVWPVRLISYLLPSTYAIRALQDVMLRGSLRYPTDLVALGGAALLAFLLTFALLRREYRPQ